VIDGTNNMRELVSIMKRLLIVFEVMKICRSDNVWLFALQSFFCRTNIVQKINWRWSERNKERERWFNEIIKKISVNPLCKQDFNTERALNLKN
jgi:hypothetical protein